jgi:hypothetical protein
MAVAAEHAHAADAAVRPQDRSFSESWCPLDHFPDLYQAARLMGNPLGRDKRISLRGS